MSNATGMATLILAAVGALAWLPTVFHVLLPQTIEGKVISQYANAGEVPGGRDASMFVQKLSLFSKNRDFFLKDVEIYLKYPTSPQEEKCTVWMWRSLVFTFDENGHSVQRKLRIDARDYLLHHTVLPRDQAVVGYLSFTSNRLQNESYEYIRYVFIDFKGKREQLRVQGKDILDNKTIFDDSIWM